MRIIITYTLLNDKYRMSKRGSEMFTNKSSNGSNNLCGARVAECRKKLGKSQRELAGILQLLGLDIDKNAIQRIEAGKRFVTDIELVYLAKAFHVSYEFLLGSEEE